MRLSLTKRSEYGIRMMLHLADRPRGERITAADLAEACEIPPGNVPTIMNMLSRSGLLLCVPGRSGGCSLARDPGEISMLEIIESLEGRLELSHCLLDSRRCNDHSPECALHAAWSHGRAAAISALERTSLSDTLEREREIAKLASRRAAAAKARAKRARAAS
ncbi:MAG: RrF2 family transcriptional regulator [Acidimicrobiales bacterium]